MGQEVGASTDPVIQRMRAAGMFADSSTQQPQSGVASGGSSDPIIAAMAQQGVFAQESAGEAPGLGDYFVAPNKALIRGVMSGGASVVAGLYNLLPGDETFATEQDVIEAVGLSGVEEATRPNPRISAAGGVPKWLLESVPEAVGYVAPVLASSALGGLGVAARTLGAAGTMALQGGQGQAEASRAATGKVDPWAVIGGGTIGALGVLGPGGMLARRGVRPLIAELVGGAAVGGASDLATQAVQKATYDPEHEIDLMRSLESAATIAATSGVIHEVTRARRQARWKAELEKVQKRAAAEQAGEEPAPEGPPPDYRYLDLDEKDQASLEHANRSIGSPGLRAVEAPSAEARAVEEAVGRSGVRVLWAVRTDHEYNPEVIPFYGFTKGDTMVLDAAMTPRRMRAVALAHELIHSGWARDAAAWSEKQKALAKVFPELARMGEAEFRQRAAQSRRADMGVAADRLATRFPELAELQPKEWIALLETKGGEGLTKALAEIGKRVPKIAGIDLNELRSEIKARAKEGLGVGKVEENRLADEEGHAYAAEMVYPLLEAMIAEPAAAARVEKGDYSKLAAAAIKTMRAFGLGNAATALERDLAKVYKRAGLSQDHPLADLPQKELFLAIRRIGASLDELLVPSERQVRALEGGLTKDQRMLRAQREFAEVSAEEHGQAQAEVGRRARAQAMLAGHAEREASRREGVLMSELEREQADAVAERDLNEEHARAVAERDRAAADEQARVDLEREHEEALARNRDVEAQLELNEEQEGLRHPEMPVPERRAGEPEGRRQIRMGARQEREVREEQFRARSEAAREELRRTAGMRREGGRFSLRLADGKKLEVWDEDVAHARVVDLQGGHHYESVTFRKMHAPYGGGEYVAIEGSIGSKLEGPTGDVIIDLLKSEQVQERKVEFENEGTPLLARLGEVMGKRLTDKNVDRAKPIPVLYASQAKSPSKRSWYNTGVFKSKAAAEEAAQRHKGMWRYADVRVQVIPKGERADRLGTLHKYEYVIHTDISKEERDLMLASVSEMLPRGITVKTAPTFAVLKGGDISRLVTELHELAAKKLASNELDFVSSGNAFGPRKEGQQRFDESPKFKYEKESRRQEEGHFSLKKDRVLASRLDAGTTSLADDAVASRMRELRATPRPTPATWAATPLEKAVAREFIFTDDIRPYTSDGPVGIELGSDGRFSIKTKENVVYEKYWDEEAEDWGLRRVGTRGTDEHTGLPLNKGGTVTLYYHTTEERARQFNNDRTLWGDTPKSRRVYLTNESNKDAVAATPGKISQELGGAVVTVNINPALLHRLDVHAPNAEGAVRRDFYVPIGEGLAFADKMAKVQLHTLTKRRGDAIDPEGSLKDVYGRLNSGLEAYLRSDKKGRAAMLKRAAEVLGEQHNVERLLTVNGKLLKTEAEHSGITWLDRNIESMGLGMAAAQKITNKANTCPLHSSCAGLCLGDNSGGNFVYGGKGAARSGPRLSQYLKTEAFVLHPEEFIVSLYDQISKFRDAVVKRGNLPSIRLNVTSDFHPRAFEALFKALPDVQFYDYTKVLGADSIAKNHHLTYSLSGMSQVVGSEAVVAPFTNWDKIVRRLLEGKNAAVPFTFFAKPGTKGREQVGSTFPKYVVDARTGEKFRVINGDTYDARFVDRIKRGRGVIVALTNKDLTSKPDWKTAYREKKTTGRTAGFFVHFDSAQGNTLTVPNQRAVALGDKANYFAKGGDAWDPASPKVEPRRVLLKTKEWLGARVPESDYDALDKAFNSVMISGEDTRSGRLSDREMAISEEEAVLKALRVVYKIPRDHVAALRTRIELLWSDKGSRETLQDVINEVSGGRPQFSLKRVTPRRLGAIGDAFAEAYAEGEATEIGTEHGPVAVTGQQPWERAFERAVRKVYGPERRAVESWAPEATGLLVNRGETESRIKAKVATGEALNPPEILAAMQIANEKAARAKHMDMGTEAGLRAIQDATRWAVIFRTARTLQAQALSVIKDAFTPRTGDEWLRMALEEPSRYLRQKMSRIEKQLREASGERRFALQEQYESAIQEVATENARALRALHDAGLAHLLDAPSGDVDPVLFARGARAIRDAKIQSMPKAERVWDWAMEYRIAAMLSNPLTTIVNDTGNSVHLFYEGFAKKAAEAFVNTFAQRPDAATFGELATYMRAWLPGLAHAGRNFLMAYRTELPVFEYDLRAKGVDVPGIHSKLDINEQAGHSIPGRLGRVVRAPSLTTLLAHDEFFRTLAGHTEAAALAYRHAKGDRAKMQEVLNDPSHEMWEQVIGHERKVTFTDRPARETEPLTFAVLDAINRVRNAPLLGPVRPGQFVLPFLFTPFRIFQRGLAVPFHPAIALSKASRGMYGEARGAAVRDIGTLLMTTGITAAIAHYVFQRDDEDGLPLLTGTRPSNRGEAALGSRSAPEMSFRWGNRYYSYSRVDPLAVSLSTIVDALNAADLSGDSGGVGSAFAAAWRSVYEQTKDKTFLRSLGDLFAALEDPEGPALARVTRDMLVTPWVPNVVRAAGRASYDLSPADNVRRHDGESAWEAMWRSVPGQALPGIAEVKNPRYDVWGQAIKTRGRSWAGRMLSPMQVTQDARDVLAIDRYIRQYNDRVARGELPNEKPFYPMPPQPYFVEKGKTSHYTDEQYAELCRLAGQRALAAVSRMNFASTPTPHDMKRIADTMTDARRWAARRVRRSTQAPAATPRRL